MLFLKKPVLKDDSVEFVAALVSERGDATGNGKKSFFGELSFGQTFVLKIV